VSEVRESPREPLWTAPFALVTAATTAVFFGLYFLVLAVPGYAAALGAGPALVSPRSPPRRRGSRSPAPRAGAGRSPSS
jgi:hypothetical protein